MKFKNSLFLAVITLSILIMGCSPSIGTGANNTPSETVKDFYNNLDKGQLDKGTQIVSASAPAALKNSPSAIATNIKSRNGIKSIDIQKEEGTEKTAEVTALVKYNNGTSETVTYNLVQEDRDWKISGAK